MSVGLTDALCENKSGKYPDYFRFLNNSFSFHFRPLKPTYGLWRNFFSDAHTLKVHWTRRLATIFRLHQTATKMSWPPDAPPLWAWVGVLKKFGSAGPCPLQMRAYLTPKTRCSPTSHAEFDRCSSLVWVYAQRYARKTWPSRSAFQGHSRSSKLTRVNLPISDP